MDAITFQHHNKPRSVVLIYAFFFHHNHKAKKKMMGFNVLYGKEDQWVQIDLFVKRLLSFTHDKDHTVVCSSDHRAQGIIIAIILTFQLIWLEHPLVDVMVYGLHGTHVFQETRIHVDKRYVVAKCHAKLQSYTSTSVDMWEAPLKG